MSDEEVGKDEEAGTQAECGCAGTDCCGPGAVPRSGLRALIFVLVLLAAGAVLAHGIVSKQKAKNADKASCSVVPADASDAPKPCCGAPVGE